MKQIKLLLLILAMLLPILANAATVEIDGIYYNLISKAMQAEVIKGDNRYSGEVRIPEKINVNGSIYTVAIIGDDAFSYNSGVTDIWIPKTIKSIYSRAFMRAEGLKTVHISDLEAWCNISFGSSPLWYAHHLFLNDEEIVNITIPQSVTEIGNGTFMGLVNLKTVTLHNKITKIGDSAFNGCTNLESIQFPNSIIEIWDNAFYGCTSLSFSELPNKLKTIGSNAFGGCTSLTTLYIPASVTNLSYAAFINCGNLNSISVAKDNPVYDSRKNCNAIISTGGNTILRGGCTTEIPNDVEALGQYSFSGCTALTNVIIPNSVRTIGAKAFDGCGNMQSVTIGKGVSYIEDWAFSNCGSLLDFYCYTNEIPQTGSNYIFENSYIEYATLHVPAGSVDAYKAKFPWSGFKEIVAIETVKVKLSKTKATIEKGKTLTLKATITPSDLPDKSVTWKSSNTKVATVSSAGKVKGVKAGTATITCISNSTGAKATCKVTVGYVKLDQTEATILKGKTVTLTPTVYPSSLSDKTVTWASSNTKVATVTTAGKVKGVKAGTATITCTSNATGLKATCTVNVVKGFVILNKTEAYVQKGKTTTLKATVTPESLTDKSVTWTSSDKSIATVSSSGKVKGVKYGTATITCTSVATGAKATCQVTIGKVVLNTPEFTLRKTRTLTLVATLYPTTLTDKSVTWKSSDTKVATVSSSGKVKGVGAGTATITCTSVATGLKGTCTVTVLAVSESRSIEGDDDDATGIDEVNVESVDVQPYDVYDLSGRKVAHQVTTLEGLPNGIYIVNGKKMIIK